MTNSVDNTTPHVGIEAVVSVLPEAVIDNLQHARSLGFEDGFLRDKIGFLQRHICAEDEGTTTLAKKALAKLAGEQNLDLNEIDCLVVCTQNPDGHGLPNTASAVHGDMALNKQCAAFDISLGCSGYVYGLSIISAFMQANGMQCGVLITSDPYSKVVVPDDRDTSALFGDGACATLLRPGAAWRIGRSKFGSDGSMRDAIAVDETGQLSMKGRQVFVFSASVVPNLIRDVVGLNGLDMDDVGLFLVHQGSRYIVDEIRKRLQVEESRLPFGAANTANLVSSSLPTLMADRLTQAPDTILLTGFGVGLSWGATILQKA
jgi:3-oxoacyl-[acyl-carrier-protein] synthase III